MGKVYFLRHWSQQPSVLFGHMWLAAIATGSVEQQRHFPGPRRKPVAQDWQCNGVMALPFAVAPAVVIWSPYIADHKSKWV